MHMFTYILTIKNLQVFKNSMNSIRQIAQKLTTPFMANIKRMLDIYDYK